MPPVLQAGFETGATERSQQTLIRNVILWISTVCPPYPVSDSEHQCNQNDIGTVQSYGDRPMRASKLYDTVTARNSFLDDLAGFS